MLRGYQTEILKRLEKAWGRHRSIMVQMPTGTGKTVLMAEAVRRLKRAGGERLRVLIVAHRRELLVQIRQTLSSIGLDDGTVDVESIQRLSATAEQGEVRARPYGLVIIDEAHHATARTYRQLWEWWPKARFLGMTATPCRLGGEAFTELFDELLQSWSIREFIRRGWLSDMDYVSVRRDGITMRKVAGLRKRGTDGDYQTKEMANVLDTPESIAHLYRSYREYCGGRKGIVYAISREHARHIAAYYRERGVSCAVIDSRTPAEERRLTVEAYRGKRIDVLVNVDIFGEGFDVPEVEFIQLARPTLSLAKYLQQVGRGMRVSEGKQKVTILDQVGLYLIFGLPTSDRDWQGMFRGTASGKGTSLAKLLEQNGLRAAEEKQLVNEEMFRLTDFVLRKELRSPRKPGQGKIVSLRQEKSNHIISSKSSHGSLQLRDYQQELVDGVEEAFRHSRRVVVQVPCGAGKACVAAALMRREMEQWCRKNRRRTVQVLFVVHRKELLHQVAGLMERYGLDCRTFSGASRRPCGEGRVTAVCAADMGKYMEWVDRYNIPALIVIDEVDAAGAGLCGRLRERFPEVRMLGMSSTPCTEDGNPLGTVFGSLVESRSISSLIGSGWLREVKVIDCETAVSSEEDLYNIYKEKAGGSRGIVFAKDAAQAERIAACYRRHGIDCETMGLHKPEQERNRLTEALGAGTIHILVDVDCCRNGMRSPDVDFIQFASCPETLSAFLHQACCAMRRKPGAVSGQLLLLDNAGACRAFGPPTADRDWKRLFKGRGKKKAKTKIRETA